LTLIVREYQPENEVLFDFVMDPPDEIFQLLHHAYAYDLATVVIAIGDLQSEIEQSITTWSQHVKR
jgi:hypothetical protein